VRWCNEISRTVLLVCTDAGVLLLGGRGVSFHDGESDKIGDEIVVATVLGIGNREIASSRRLPSFLFGATVNYTSRRSLVRSIVTGQLARSSLAAGSGHVERISSLTFILNSCS